MAETKEIGYIDITDEKRLVLSLGDFRGAERLDLREHYLNKEGSFLPTKRGVNFSSEWLDKFVGLIEKLRDV